LFVCLINFTLYFLSSLLSSFLVRSWLGGTAVERQSWKCRGISPCLSTGLPVRVLSCFVDSVAKITTVGYSNVLCPFYGLVLG